MTKARNFLAFFTEYLFPLFLCKARKGNWEKGRLLWKLYGNSQSVLAESSGHATFALEKLKEFPAGMP